MSTEPQLPTAAEMCFYFVPVKFLTISTALKKCSGSSSFVSSFVITSAATATTATATSSK